VVQQIERLNADLELALAVDVEPANDTRIDVCHARTAEFVPMRIAKVRRNDRRWVLSCRVGRLNRIGEGCRVEPGHTAGDSTTTGRAVAAAELVVRLNEIGVQRVARRIDRRGLRANRERRAAGMADLAVQLKTAEDRGRDALVGKLLTIAKR